jgi:hypothetical protein
MFYPAMLFMAGGSPVIFSFYLMRVFRRTSDFCLLTLQLFILLKYI